HRLHGSALLSGPPRGVAPLTKGDAGATTVPPGELRDGGASPARLAGPTMTTEATSAGRRGPRAQGNSALWGKVLVRGAGELCQPHCAFGCRPPCSKVWWRRR